MRLRPILKYAFLPVLLAVFTYLIFSTYDEVKQRRIDEFNFDQLVLAKQAARGIESFFTYYLTELSFLSTIEYVVNLDERGKDLLDNFYRSHADQIEAITRVEANGKISYTAPYRKESMGKDISYQEHVKRVIEAKRPVISKVFLAVQGYRTVAYHIPVFDKKEFKGSIAILVPLAKLAKKYLENIHIAETGHAWMLSSGGVELYCPIPGHTGKNVEETAGEFESVMKMVKEILKGGQGKYQYEYGHISNGKSDAVTKLAVYYPVNLGNTFWSIVISAPEVEVYSTLQGFRNRLFIIIAIIFIVSLFYFYSFIKTWKIVKEEKKRKLAESALKQSEHLLRNIADNYPNSYVSIIERDLTIGFSAGKEYSKNNLNPDDFTGRKVTEIFGENSEFVLGKYLKAFGGEEVTFELFISNQHQLYNCVPLIKEGDEFTKILVVAENISERKLAEDLIKRNLKEKEVLLKEIHHRVKNNLNVIVSLLNLQTGEIKNEIDAKMACRQSVDRIKSMALVHERLYQSEDFSQIEFNEYIISVVTELKNIYDHENIVDIEFNLEEAVMELGKAIPCGLILNELTTNAMKHAFENAESGNVTINFCKRDEESFCLVVEDNGKGMPNNFDMESAESLGLNLVRILTKQIEGEILLESNAGTRIEVRFPI